MAQSASASTFRSTPAPAPTRSARRARTPTRRTSRQTTTCWCRTSAATGSTGIAVDATGAFVGEPGVTQLAAGAGPRHVERHPTLPVLYVINELGNTIDVLERGRRQSDAESCKPFRRCRTALTASSTTSEIIVSADGRFVYGSNRGHDSIVSFAVDDAGRLSAPEYVSTRGEHPRFFTARSQRRVAARRQPELGQRRRIRAGRRARPRDVVCETARAEGLFACLFWPIPGRSGRTQTMEYVNFGRGWRPASADWLSVWVSGARTTPPRHKGRSSTR